MSKFEIVLFSYPTQGHFCHYWKLAQEKGIGQKEFETLWFEAYNKFVARIAEDNFRKRAPSMASIVIEKGEDAKTRNVGRRFINEELKKINKHYETKIAPIQLEKEDD